jgi:hypothetical protein
MQWFKNWRWKQFPLASAKNIGKKEKYYLKVSLYYKKFQTFIMIQWNQNDYLTVNWCELTNYQIC